MATVFSRIVAYCEANHKCIISPEKRNELGIKISSYWHGTFRQPLPRVSQLEPEGRTYDVCDYPDWFSPKIDQFVEEFYQEMRKNRKKIPMPNKLKNNNSHAA